MKKNKKYKDGGRLFVTMPFGGSVANSPVIPGQLPDYQMGSNVNSGVIQNNLRDIKHFYGENFPYMAEGGDMEDESGATDSFYTNKVNGFIDRVRGTAQKNLENNLLKEAMREMRGDDETVEYGPEDMEMAAYGMTAGTETQNTYDPSTIQIFANAYNKTKPFNKYLQDFGKMNRIIQPAYEYQKKKSKYDLGFSDMFKKDNPWVDSSGNQVNYTKVSFEDGGTLIPMFQGDDDESTVGFWTPEEEAYLKGLSNKDRMAILKKGDLASKQHVQSVMAGNQPQAQPQSQPQTQSKGKASVTANKTDVNTTGSNKGFQEGDVVKADGSVWRNGVMVSNGKGTISENNPKPSPFDGYNWHTDANGNKYIVTPEGQLYSPYMGAAGSQNVYTPQQYYNPYSKNNYGDTYNVMQRNQLTPEFRAAMRSGILNNPEPQLLGLPHIEFRKALFPKNRNKEIKSISWQYGNLQGDPFADNTGTPGSRTTVPGAKKTTPGVTTPDINSPAVDAANAWNYRPNQNWEGKYEDLPANGPVNPNSGAGPLAIPGPGEEPPFQSGYVPGSPEYPNVPGYNTLTGMPKIDIGTDPGFNPDAILNPDRRNTDPGFNPGADSEKNMDPGFNPSKALNPNVNPTGQSSSSTNPNDWRNYKPAGLDYSKNDVSSYWDNIKAGKDFTTPSKNVTADEAKEKQKIIDQTSKLPRALQMHVRDAVFNTSVDPRLDLMYAAGVQGADGLFLGNKKTGVDANGNPIQVSDPSLRVALRDNKAEIDRLWNDPKTQALITQQYNDDPEAFTSAFGDQRKVSYSRIEKKNGNISVRYPGWAGRVDNTTNNWDTFDNLPASLMDNAYNTIIADNETRYGTTELKKKFGGPLFKAQVGPPNWADLMEQADEQNDQGLADIGPIDPNTRQPLKRPEVTMTDMDRINAIDSGTEYDKKNDPNTWFIENPFNVKDKFKTRKQRDPWAAIQKINLATGLFNLDEMGRGKNQLKGFTPASQAFNNVDNNLGRYNPLTGQYMGPRGLEPPVINSGFAQYGGSLYDNLKQGDEIYLTQGQIDELLKRGVKLSYLD